MPAFTKPTEDTLRTFERAVGGIVGVERRTMFGYPSVFLNGNMLACVFQDRIMVRLEERDRADAIASHGARPFEPSPGRPMKEYVELPTDVLADDSALRQWFARSRAYVSSLPPKTKKPGKRR
jgi:TfoX/Sxy family transcriptional regulator of competence genes